MTDKNEFQDSYRTWHTRVSYAKSAVRIIACAGVFLFGGNALYILAGGLLLAEVLGVAEEWI